MKNKGLKSALSIFAGFLLNAFAWSTKIGHPLSTIFLLLGIGLMFFGLLLLIMFVNEK